MIKWYLLDLFALIFLKFRKKAMKNIPIYILDLIKKKRKCKYKNKYITICIYINKYKKKFNDFIYLLRYFLFGLENIENEKIISCYNLKTVPKVWMAKVSSAKGLNVNV